jgi:hypothetical protein
MWKMIMIVMLPALVFASPGLSMDHESAAATFAVD